MNDYLLEQLGPEKFQHLAQALILSEDSSVACFPVGQADGGRDAVSFHSRDDGARILYQVKYVREPQRQNARSKVAKAISEETHKVVKLLEESTFDRYVVVTNVQGSATHETGSIDTVAKALGSIPVPAEVWWRDDVNRRLDATASVRWAYPELLRAPDLLAALVLRPSPGDPLTGPLRAYIADQAEGDSEVRFKQVDLQNDLFSLFVDVPIAPSTQYKSEAEARRTPYRFAGVLEAAGLAKADSARTHLKYTPQDGLPTVGAAEFLLAPPASSAYPWIVLEGGPGQGKSTLAQYVCQRYRLNLLGADASAGGALRLPFKVDLRELSMWLDGLNPLVDAHSAHGQTKSTEAFLAASVSQAAGGASFSVDDLLEIFARSASLLVFDGLDEIAELASRNKVVNELNQFLRRCTTYDFSVSAVVTTRPSALTGLRPFAKSWTSFQLQALNEDLIREYAGRWCEAKGIAGAVRKSLQRVLSERLRESHIAELSRNPMQLAIFLSLLHSRGVSLPDKRTALYDLYVELFFAREAEKSEIVKRHLELLVDVHRFLAWTLHSEAEVKSSLGRIEEARLRRILREYLIREGRRPEQVDELFDGISQRVVFLVARIEGTFEFEVQPLREYFVGKHLYETAPYSPPGREATGTKPDRFDALARRPYWSNATRFFAGCFSKGELPGLAERLEVLGQDADFGATNIPGTLSAALLGDWVFSQSPRSQNAIIDLVVSRPLLRSLIANGRPSFRGAAGQLSLPDGCGRDQLVDACLVGLRQANQSDELVDLARVIQLNASQAEIDSVWRQEMANAVGKPDDLARWVLLGRRLGVLGRIAAQDLGEMLGEAAADERVLRMVVQSDRSDVLSKMVEQQVLELASEEDFGGSHDREDALTLAIHALGPIGYYGLFNARRDSESLHEAQNALWMLERRGRAPSPPRQETTLRIAEAYSEQAERSVREWRQGPEPWRAISAVVDEVLPRSWARYRIAVVSSMTLSSVVTDSEGSEDWSDLQSIAWRARSKFRARVWWERAFETATSNNERRFLAALAVLHCGPNTLISLLPNIEPVLYGKGGAENYARVATLCRQVTIFARHRRADGRALDLSRLPENLRPRTLALLTDYASSSAVPGLLERLFASRRMDEEQLIAFARFGLRVAGDGTMSWESVLPGVRAAYSKGMRVETPPRLTVPHQIAQEICRNSEKYPTDLLQAAQNEHARTLLSTQIPLATVADKEKWFDLN